MTSVTSAGAVHLGMDTSKDTIVVAVLLPGEELPAVDRIVNREEAVRRLIGRLGDQGRLRACYEAGPGGYDLYRLLASMGVACDVVAPSLIPKGGSDRVKTDPLTELREGLGQVSGRLGVWVSTVADRGHRGGCAAGSVAAGGAAARVA